MSDAIYLCTQQQLIGDADDDRALAQMQLLASILDKLGYRLMSGEAPNLHELWAAPIVAAPRRTPRPNGRRSTRKVDRRIH